MPECFPPPPKKKLGKLVFLSSLPPFLLKGACMHAPCYHSVNLLGTCAEVQIEIVMCANAFRAEVRPALSFSVANSGNTSHNMVN